MKLGFLLSVALAVMTVVAVVMIWLVLNAVGVFDSVGQTLRDVTGTDTGGGVEVQSFLSLPRVLGFTMLIGLFNIVFMTALATLAAFLYNLAASIVGGLEVTFVEGD